MVTYILVDRLGEWKKRRNYSKLGIAIIESLQEEVKMGINIMTEVLAASTSEPRGLLQNKLLPNESWDGMATISDEVLLRIIATSDKKTFDGFPPKDCRIHCKNYFNFMNQNYKERLKTAIALAHENKDWGPTFYNFDS